MAPFKGLEFLKEISGMKAAVGRTADMGRRSNGRTHARRSGFRRTRTGR
jgi:hypothetical protein